MIRKRLAGRPTAFEGGDICDLLCHAFSRDLILGGVGLEFFDLPFEGGGSPIMDGKV